MTGLLTLLKMLSGFLIAKVVAIYTGPSGLAMLGQIQSVASCLNGLVSAPAGVGIVRYTSEYSRLGFKACRPWWIASVQWISIIAAIVIPLGLLLASKLSVWLFQSSDYYWAISVVVIMLPITSLGTLITSIINGQQLFKYYIFAGIVSVIISTIIMVCLITKNNLNGALLAAAMQSGLVGIIMIITALHLPWFKLHYFWGKTSLKHKKEIGGYVLMAITSAVFVPISLVLVRKIIIEHAGINEAGYWQAVWKISEAYLGVVTVALGTYYLPKLSILKNAEEIRSTIINTTKVILPTIIFLALLVYLLRDLVINVLFTEEFSVARDLFSIQLIGDVVKIISWLIAFPMISKGKVLWYVSSEIIFSLLFVLLSLLFVPYYSTQGANIAYLINYILYLAFVLIFYNRIIK